MPILNSNSKAYNSINPNFITCESSLSQDIKSFNKHPNNTVSNNNEDPWFIMPVEDNVLDDDFVRRSERGQA
jgi:hypothetical protein